MNEHCFLDQSIVKQFDIKTEVVNSIKISHMTCSSSHKAEFRQWDYNHPMIVIPSLLRCTISIVMLSESNHRNYVCTRCIWIYWYFQRSPSRRNRRDTTAAQNDAIPLLPVDEGRLPRQNPPTSGPEMDDDDGPTFIGPRDNRGIDDGFLPEKPTRNDRDLDVDRRRSPGRRNSNPTVPFPYAPEFGPQLPPVI